MLGTLVFALALQEADAGTVTLGTATAAPGESVTLTSAVELDQSIVFTVAGAKLRDFERRIRDTRSVTVTADASQDGAPAVRLQYGECRSVLIDPTGEDVNVLAVDSLRYRVERRPDGSLAVHELDARDEAHEVTDAAVLAQTTRDATELLLGARFGPVLGGRPLAIGRPIDVPADVASALLAGFLDGVTIVRFALTPKAPPDAESPVELAAAIELELRAGEELEVRSTFELTGRIVLARASARLLELELAGPVRSSGAQERRDARVEVTGTGQLAWKVRVEPLVPR